MTDRELMQQALEALELLARHEHPLTKIQVRKPRDGGSIVTVYPHQVATDAAEPLRERLAQPQMQPCAGRNCGSTNPNLHSAECFEDYEKSTGMAQPEQEPVAWEDVLGAIARGWAHDDNKHKTMDVQLAVAIAKEIQDMVIAPPQRKPLTDEEIDKIYETKVWDARRSFARAIEAAHDIKEKNT